MDRLSELAARASTVAVCPDRLVRPFEDVAKMLFQRGFDFAFSTNGIVVKDAAKAADVEGERRAARRRLFGEQDRRGADGMRVAELIVDVWVPWRNLRDDDLRRADSPHDVLQNDAGPKHVVGAVGFKPEVLRHWPD